MKLHSCLSTGEPEGSGGSAGLVPSFLGEPKGREVGQAKRSGVGPMRGPTLLSLLRCHRLPPVSGMAPGYGQGGWPVQTGARPRFVFRPGSWAVSAARHAPAGQAARESAPRANLPASGGQDRRWDVSKHVGQTPRRQRNSGGSHPRNAAPCLCPGVYALLRGLQALFP